MTPEQTISILYDLAMTMAGETRSQMLATSMLQRLMFHTGCSCGLLLLNPRPSEDGKGISADTYAAVGSPILRAMEGKTQIWPFEILNEGNPELPADWLPPGTTPRFAFRLELPGTGEVLLFSSRPHENAIEQRNLLAPVLAKFSSALQHCLESERNEHRLTENETRIRDIVESSPDWIWETTPHAVITYSNEKIHALLGREPDEVVGKTFFDFMPESEARHISWTFRDIVAKETPFNNLESVCLHNDGHEVVLETSGVPVFDARGELTGYRGVTRDISERKRDEMILKKARDDAKASDRAKSIFLSGMSHEFRTPLNAILGHAQLIGMQADISEEAADSAKEILQAGKILLSLVDHILELTRLGSSGNELRIVSFPVEEVILASVARHEEEAALKHVSIQYDSSCVHMKVMADRRSLITTMSHLVSNAVRYNRDGGEVHIACQPTTRNMLRVSVRDNGSGISAEDQKRLFIPFSRLSREKGKIQGAGIGLVIARQMVEDMSGSMGLDSVPGKGSTFWFEIPLAASDKGLATKRDAPASKPKETLPTTMRVLVAEDYAPNQALIKMQLSRLGCEVDIAGNGLEALNLWEKQPYSLILADLNMPVMDGLSLTRAIREKESGKGLHIPIICVTAAAVASEMEACRKAGMDDVLIKPIALEGLRGILQRWGNPSGIPASDANPQPEKSPESSLIDIQYLYGILGDNNEEQARQLIGTFIESAGQGLAQLSANDATQISREMHKQKSSARTVGALGYAKLAETLEQEIKAGRAKDINASLEALREELSRIRKASAEMRMSTSGKPDTLPDLSGHGSVMVVDDDPVVLQQMSAMLTSLGIRDVLTAISGRDALKQLGDRNGDLEVLICDLNMPEMDGVELIRLFGRTGFKGKLILMSGADEKVLSTVGKLADLQGLHVLGQLMKPVASSQIVKLLSQTGGTQPRKRQQDNKVMEVSPQAIREAMDRDEFTAWLQPKVDANTLKPIGVETLARWQHPGRGNIPPDVFIGVAEREGLIKELSQVLVAKALMEGAKLHEAGYPLSISLNLSGLWLDDLLLPDFILATTYAAKLKPSDVILEVTETGVMKDLTTALDVLTRLRLKGFGLSIDDFGIGYSSFEQLDRIPFTELKLDRIFVSRGAHDATARAILQSSMDMARRMALSTVAEGVETTGDLELVRKMGCNSIQGFLIAKPMPTEQAIDWLNRQPA